MTQTVANYCLVVVAFSMILCFWRLWRGPSIADRALALDTLAVNLVSVIALMSILFGTTAYFDALLVIAVIGFLGTVAVGKYLLKGDIID